jgi:hypothetical protein
VRDWEFGFSGYGGPLGDVTLFEWFDLYGTDDVGKIFAAPNEVVNGAAEALSTPSSIYLMFTAGVSNPSAPGRLVDWNTANCNPCARILVLDPTVYRVTAVERIIDDLIVQATQPGTTWVIGGKQTVRVLGEPVPEPTALLLLIVGLAQRPFHDSSRDLKAIL